MLLRELDSLLDFDSQDFILHNSKFFNYTDDTSKYPLEETTLLLIIHSSAFIAHHFAASPDGQKEVDSAEIGGSYIGNITIDSPLEYAREGGMLTPEIFQSFGIDLNHYDLTDTSFSYQG